MNSGVANIGFFGFVDVAHADERYVGGFDNRNAGLIRFTNSGVPRPTSEASAMPWTLPLGVVAGVFMSA